MLSCAIEWVSECTIGWADVRVNACVREWVRDWFIGWIGEQVRACVRGECIEWLRGYVWTSASEWMTKWASACVIDWVGECVRAGGRECIEWLCAYVWTSASACVRACVRACVSECPSEWVLACVTHPSSEKVNEWPVISQENSQMPASLAFWIANASELLHFLKRDRDIFLHSRDGQQILTSSIQMAFRSLVHCVQQELKSFMSAFLDDTDDADMADMDFDAMSDPDSPEHAMTANERSFRFAPSGRPLGSDQWLGKNWDMRTPQHPPRSPSPPSLPHPAFPWTTPTNCSYLRGTCSVMTPNNLYIWLD